REVEPVLAAGDAAALAELASLSLDLNDKYYGKAEMPLLRRLRRDGVILGYFGAHSGTCFGGICRPADTDRVALAFRDALGPGYRVVGWAVDSRNHGLPFLLGQPRHDFIT